MSSAPYVELHCHSAYSFLDGASTPRELVRAAARLGHTHLALTDHDNLCGALELVEAVEALEQAGGPALQPIHGAELTVVDAPPPMRGGTVVGDWGLERTRVRHLTLLVRDARGWRNLCRLLTAAHAHVRDHPQRTAGRPWVTIADVCDRHEGLICLTGCAGHGVEDEAGLRTLREAFGYQDLYVELQRRYLRGDREHARERTRLARRLGLRCVATGNVHAHDRDRAQLQDALVAVRHRTTLDASEPLRRGNHSHVLTTPQAMRARFADQPDAVAETVRLAERLEFRLKDHLGYRYPGQEDAEMPQRLAEVCRARFEERYAPGALVLGPRERRAPAEIRRRAHERLEQELALIQKLGLSGFFHLHHEILELARQVAVEVRGPSAARRLLAPGRGRGSSVSSIVCYLTGLSHVDPVLNELSIGRFLHDDLGETLPDIDLDFPRDVRERLILRVGERYGDERSALVAAFPTYRARGAIRDLGAALGLPAAELERVARGSEGWSGRSVADDIASALGLRPDGQPPHADEPLRDEGSAPPPEPDGPAKGDPGRGLPGRWAWLARLSAMAHGLPRHLSQHPGGMIISTQPLIDCCPIVPSAMEGRRMVMWDKESCADAGFAKIDLLGLGMLSCVERAVELISARRDPDDPFDLARVPLDDEQTFEAIQQAETTGVFQIESRAQMGSLLRTRPENLEDLAVQVAIVRPGPIQGGAVNPYIARRQQRREELERGVPEDRLTPPPVPHHALEGPLRPTLGTILFQDQVVEIAQSFAGFSPGRAEGLRRAMSSKRSEEAMEAEHEGFVAGAMARHEDVTRELAEQVWGMVSGFSGFGFPKAHAAAFGLLAYQSTWLRVHHRVEFLCALLDEQPMGFYPPDALIHEAQRHDIEVLPPDVDRSQVHCTIVGEQAIRLGLGYVKGVRRDEVEALVAERERHGPWRSATDLAARLGTVSGSLERLAWSGACDGLVARDEQGREVPEGRRRRAALWQLGIATPGRAQRDGTQLALELRSAHSSGGAAGVVLPGMDAWERLIADYASTGLTAGPHPMLLLRSQAQAHGVRRSDELPGIRHGSPVRVAGLVLARQRPGSAKGVTFLLLEDEKGTVNLVVPPSVYVRDRLAVRTEPLVAADGRLERHPAGGGQINVVVGRLRPLDALTDETGAVVRQLRESTPEQLVAQAEEQERLAAVAGGAVAADGGAVAGPGRGPGGGGGAAAGRRRGRGPADAGEPEPGALRAVAPDVMHFGRGRGGR